MNVNTVLGPVDVNELGTTLMHEHLATISQDMLIAYGKDWFDREETLKTFEREIEKAKACGLRTFVEGTVPGLGRDVTLLIEAAKRTGVHILACTGVYFFEDPWFNAIDADVLAEWMIRDVTVGMQGTSAKAALVKCATDKLYGASETNRQMIRAAAIASKETGVPIYAHALSSERYGLFQTDVLIGEGVTPNRILIGHAFTSNDYAYIKELVKRGVYVGCDQSGSCEALNCSITSLADNVAKLCSEGYSKQIVLSHDRNTTSDFAFGLNRIKRDRSVNVLTGNYTRVFQELVPLLRERGVTQEQVDDMLIQNPRRYFAGEFIQ